MSGLAKTKAMNEFEGQVFEGELNELMLVPGKDLFDC
jgi:hypothetical protein